MATDVEGIRALYSATEAGFMAILDSVAEHMIEALRRALGHRNRNSQHPTWVDARKEFNIYALSRRRKSVDRLVKKVRNWALDTGQDDLSTHNFYKHVPDILGARLICLHPDDLLRVALVLKNLGKDKTLFRGPPPQLKYLTKLRVRRGPFTMLPIEDFRKHGFKIDKPHPAGYTSIHILFRLGPSFIERTESSFRDKVIELQKKSIQVEECLVEIQLRTILEEAWAEMDHSMRYEDDALATDPELRRHFLAMAAYIQAGNHHISVIRDLAREKSLTVLGDPHAH